MRIRESKVKPKTFIKLLKLIDKGKITERLAKEVIKEYVTSGESPERIVKKKKLTRIEERELEKIVKRILKENKMAVEDYKSGNEKTMEFLIGRTLRKTKIRADPKVVRKLIKKVKSSSLFPGAYYKPVVKQENYIFN